MGFEGIEDTIGQGAKLVITKLELIFSKQLEDVIVLGAKLVIAK